MGCLNPQSRRVHPRVCGERYLVPHPSLLVDGSSPRVRGTAARLGAGARRDRFIPACAGNGSPSRRSASATTVHPRVCGERIGEGPHKGLDAGSSPRVRGTVRGTPMAGGRVRFIPACAGNGSKIRRTT